MEKLDYLIKYLLKENKDVRISEIPIDQESKKKLYRSLCNIRDPKPIDTEYIQMENTYLQEELKKKDITKAKEIKKIDQIMKKSGLENKDKIYLWQGDITKLEINAIVNAGNSQGLGCFIPCHNCIDNSIHSASFYPFSSQEEKWAFWARLIKLNRLNKPLKLYQELLETMKEKEYFVLTTNVDGQFEIAGFNNDKIFAIQGDYSFIQCEEGCHDKLYNNKNMVEEWIKNTKNCKIPKDLVPKCPVCGKNMEMNLRKDANFVQDEKWYIQAKRYEEFLEKAKSKKLVLLEIGVGFNTPGIIRLPFEQMTYHNLRTSLIRINKDYPFASHEIENRMISFNEDTNRIIEDLKEK